MQEPDYWQITDWQEKPKSRQETGRWGEDLACQILQAQGYRLLARNWRPTSQRGQERLRGEIDLIMEDPNQELVFIEVKTRSSSRQGHPLEAIGPAKVTKLRQLAYRWLDEQRGFIGYFSYRIDALAICGGPSSFSFEQRKAVV